MSSVIPSPRRNGHPTETAIPVVVFRIVWEWHSWEEIAVTCLIYQSRAVYRIVSHAPIREPVCHHDVVGAAGANTGRVSCPALSPGCNHSVLLLSGIRLAGVNATLIISGGSHTGGFDQSAIGVLDCLMSRIQSQIQSHTHHRRRRHKSKGRVHPRVHHHHPKDGACATELPVVLSGMSSVSE